MIRDGKNGLKVAGESFPVRLLAQADYSGAEEFERSWVLEGNAKASVSKGKLLVNAFGADTAATLWYRGEFHADLAVEFAGITVPPHGACNFNMFLHATELDGSDVLSRPKSGAYTEYHGINNYIFTFTQGWSRFRRDPGFHCISENLTTQAKPDTPYHIVIVQSSGSEGPGSRFRAFINNRLVHDVTDPEPHTHGRIALRTWNTALAYDTFRVWKLL